MLPKSNFLSLFLKALVAAVAVMAPIPVFAQPPKVSDLDWAKIARMAPLHLAQGILNFRMDLNEYYPRFNNDERPIRTSL